MKTKTNLLSIATIVALLFCVILIQIKKTKSSKTAIISNEVKNYTISPDALSLMAIGQNKLISSYLWMNTLLFSDHEHVKPQESSWMYYRFKIISELNPYFYENYKYGGLYLSIVKNDLLGADDIYKRGLQLYIDDEFLLWNSAFNLCMEMGRCKDAAPLFMRLDKLNSKRYPLSGRIAAKITAGLGFEEEAFISLLNTYNKMPIGPLKESTFKTLYTLKAIIDTNCLNEGKENCDYFDLEKNKYKVKNGLYYYDTTYEDAKIYIK